MANKVLNNVVLNWCKFSKVDQYGHYGCELVLNKEHVKRLKELGLTTKKSKDGSEDVFRARCKEEDGPVEVVDAKLNRITSTVANGATANVMLDVYEYKRYGGGIAARLKKVQLLEWEPYDEGEGFEIVED